MTALLEAARAALSEAAAVSAVNIIVGYWLAQLLHRYFILRWQREWQRRGWTDARIAHAVTLIYTALSFARVFIITFFTLLAIALFGV